MLRFPPALAAILLLAFVVSPAPAFAQSDVHISTSVRNTENGVEVTGFASSNGAPIDDITIEFEHGDGFITIQESGEFKVFVSDPKRVRSVAITAYDVFGQHKTVVVYVD